MTCKIHDDAEQDTALADGLCPLCLAEKLKTLSAPAQPAQGWRLLSDGETTQVGDEFFNMAYQKWDDIGEWVGGKVEGGIVRRRLSQPALPDAVRAVVEACQPFLKHSMWPYPQQVEALRSAVTALGREKGE